MFSFKAIKLGYVGWLLILVQSTPSASPTLSLDYTLQAEVHDTEEDLMYSSFRIGLFDDYNSSRVTAQYDLASNLFYEHLNNEDNTQWEGSLYTSYNLLKPISLYLDLELTEIGLPGSNEVDQLNSQTFTTLGTGIEYVMDASDRGSFIVNLSTQIFMYEASPLDAQEDTIQFQYLYPLSSTSDFTTTYSRINQQYDSEPERINDTIIDRLSIEYQKRFTTLAFNLFIDQNSVEYSNIPFEEDFEGYGVEINYQLNTRSTIILSTSNQIQQVFSINENLLLPQIPILEPGLVETDTVSLEYNYQTALNSFIFRLYQTDIRDLTELNDDRLEGRVLEFTQILDEKLSANLGYEQTRNFQDNDQLDLATAGLTYRILESPRTFSSISLQVEEGEENNINRHDATIEYVFTSRIY